MAFVIFFFPCKSQFWLFFAFVCGGIHFHVIIVFFILCDLAFCRSPHFYLSHYRILTPRVSHIRRGTLTAIQFSLFHYVVSKLWHIHSTAMHWKSCLASQFCLWSCLSPEWGIFMVKPGYFFFIPMYMGLFEFLIFVFIVLWFLGFWKFSWVEICYYYFSCVRVLIENCSAWFKILKLRYWVYGYVN